MKRYNTLLLVLSVLLFAGCKESVDYNYQNAVEQGDFVKAHDILSKLHQKYSEIFREEVGNCDYFFESTFWHKADGDEKIEAAADDYATAITYVIRKEIMVILAQNETNSTDVISGLLYDIQMLGEKIPEHTCVNTGGGSATAQNRCKMLCYMKYSKITNELSSFVLDKAIEAGNLELAKVALKHFQQNAEIEKEEYSYYSRYFDEDLNAAQVKFEKALQDKLFE